MRRFIFLLLFLLSSPLYAQTIEKITDQPDLPSESYAAPHNVYTIVDDTNTIPFNTFKIALDDVGRLAQKTITLAGNTALSGTDPYFISVITTNPAFELTVPAGMSVCITNITQATIPVQVVLVGAGGLIPLDPGEALWAAWDGVQHREATSLRVTVDHVINGNGTDPVSEDAVKDYVDGLSYLTIDQVINGSSSTAVTSEAAVKAFGDNIGMVRAGDVVVVGTANTATDTAAMNAAVTALNTLNTGTLWIVGEVWIDSDFRFQDPISLRGIGGNAAFRVKGSAANIAWLPSGFYYNVISTAGITGSPVATAISDTGAPFATHFISASQSFNAGEWVALYSSDDIPGVAPHYTNGDQYPLEMHHIKANVGGDRYLLGDFIVDRLQTNPEVRRLPMMTQPGSTVSNVIIDNLTFRQDAGITNSRLIDIRCLNGVTLRNLVWEATATAGAPGHCLFYCCANVRIENCHNLGVEDYDDLGYWMEFASTNGVVAQGCSSRRVRHAFDTTAGYEGGTTRYGTPINTLITDCVFYSEGKVGSSLFQISTHPEGYGYTVSNCKFHVSPGNTVLSVSDGITNGTTTITTAAPAGFNSNHIGREILVSGGTGGIVAVAKEIQAVINPSEIVVDSATGLTAGTAVVLSMNESAGQLATFRSRKASFINNVVFGGAGSAGGVFIGADDCTVSGNQFNNVRTTIVVDYQPTDNNNQPDRAVITRNKFASAAGATPVILEAGVNHIVSKNEFTDLTSSAIVCNGTADQVTGLDIGYNEFIRCAGTYVISFTATGIYSVADTSIHHNTFRDCLGIPFANDGGATVTAVVYGSNIHISHNIFDNCDGTSLLKFVDDGTTVGHRVTHNEVSKGSNTNFIDVGSLGAAAIKIRGNVADGYTAGSLGLTGTNAAAIDAAEDDFNWIDP